MGAFWFGPQFYRPGRLTVLTAHAFKICALHSFPFRASRVGPELVYKLTVVSLDLEIIGSWHSELAFGAEINGNNYKNKEYSDLGFLSLFGVPIVRLVSFTFGFHKFTPLKLQ